MRTSFLIVTGLLLAAGVGAGVHAQALGTLTTQDYIDIQHIYAEYNQSIDRGDPDGWAATFTVDGAFNNAVGREALTETARKSASGPNAGRTRHMNMSLIVKSTSTTTATGRAYLMLMDHGVAPARPVLTGVYEDDLVKTPEGWRFKKRTLKTDPRPAN